MVPLLHGRKILSFRDLGSSERILSPTRITKGPGLELHVRISFVWVFLVTITSAVAAPPARDGSPRDDDTKKPSYAQFDLAPDPEVLTQYFRELSDEGESSSPNPEKSLPIELPY